MARTYFHVTNLTDEIETEVLVEYSASGGCAAQTYGPAENCYPAEAPEIEIVGVWLNTVSDADGNNIPVTLSDADSDRIHQRIAETHEDDGYDEDY